jgi:hypothetical protein
MIFIRFIYVIYIYSLDIPAYKLYGKENSIVKATSYVTTFYTSFI